MSTLTPVASTSRAAPAKYHEYEAFLQDSFDANSYATKVLAGDKGIDLHLATSDVSGALSKLNSGIDDVNRQLRHEITTHHSALLSQAAAITTLDDSLSKVKAGLVEVDHGVDRLRRKIALPHRELSTCLSHLDRLQQTSDLVRRAARIVQLARRLELQTSELDDAAVQKTHAKNAVSQLKDRALAEAALTLAELEHLRRDESSSDDEQSAVNSLRKLKALQPHLASIDRARSKVTNEMEDMLRIGLTDLNQEILASSLQTAANLGILPQVAAGLVTDLTEAIEARIRATFDMASLAKEIAAKEPATTTSAFAYKARARTEPTNSNLAQWAAVFWARLEQLIQDMAECCTKVYTLEKVLKIKTDPLTSASFLESCMGLLEHKPTFTFWTTLSSAFEVHCKEVLKSSFAQQTLGQFYPRLLRLFHEFFAKIAAYTDTIYSQTQQSPETVLLLRAVLPFEALFLTRCKTRLNDAVTSAFSGGARSPPGGNEGLSAARAVCNELDASRFDPLLVRSVAKNAARSVELFEQKAQGLVATDYSAHSLARNVSPAPPSQQLNAELINALYHFWQPLNRFYNSEFSESSGVPDILGPAVGKLKTTLFSVVAPILSATKKEGASILAKMHRANFDKPAVVENGNISPYMKELSDKVAYIRTDVLGLFRTGSLSTEWTTDFARYLIRDFVLHATLVRPLGEMGKLKLVSDLTALEFSISQLLSDHKLGLAALGEDFTTLRALRPMLFLDTSELADPKSTATVPLLPLLHHVIVRSPLSLPHQLHGWQEAEYVRWLNEHDEGERLQLIRSVVADFEESPTIEGQEYVDILKTLLARSNASK